MFKLNTAVANFPVGCFIQTADGAEKTTGAPTGTFVADGTPGALTGSASYDAVGKCWVWSEVQAAAMNGAIVGLVFNLAACLPIVFVIHTNTKLVSDLNDIAATAIVSSGAITTATGAVTTVTGVTNTVDANLVSILGQAITGTAAWFAAAFSNFFNIQTPTGTVNSLPAAIPGVNTGLPVLNANLEVPKVKVVTDGVGLTDDAITSAKFDESTAFPLKKADTGTTEVARTGADADTLETLSDQIDAIPTSAGAPELT